MIPGTLRPLPKKLKEVKDAADRLCSKVEYDYETTKDIFRSSGDFTFEEIRNHYIRNAQYYNEIQPILKDADKQLAKYTTDSLLRDLVFKMYNRVERNEQRLYQDVQRMDTLLMSRRKKFIDETIPVIRDEIKSKLSFMRDLDFEELMKDSKQYSDTISKIVTRVDILRDEYTKLLDGSFDVKDMYDYLEEKINDLDDELKEYLLILATCKMEMLTEDSIRFIEEGKKIENKYEEEQTSELIEESQEYLESTKPILEEMRSLRIDIPKKAMKKDFEEKFRNLRSKYEANKKDLESVVENLSTKSRLLETNIERIKALKEFSLDYSADVTETIETLKIKKKGAFKFYLKNEAIPNMVLLESGIVQMTKAEELTADKIDDTIVKMEEIDNTKLYSSWILGFRSTKFGEKTYEISMKIKKWIVKASKKTAEFLKIQFNKLKAFIKAQIEKIKTAQQERKQKKAEEKKSEIVAEE